MNEKVEEALKVVKDALAAVPNGSRHIVVLDRGWVFVGDLQQQEDKTWLLVNAKNIRRWAKGGFGLLSRSARESEAVLDECAPIRFDGSAMILRVPVGRGWDAE